jgi:hypothetical protein
VPERPTRKYCVLVSSCSGWFLGLQAMSSIANPIIQHLHISFKILHATCMYRNANFRVCIVSSILASCNECTNGLPDLFLCNAMLFVHVAYINSN